MAPGGATDQIARLLAPPLSRAMGVPVIVENKAGAGGVVGTQLFVKRGPTATPLLLATKFDECRRAAPGRQTGLRPDQRLHASAAAVLFQT
ncbi:tripartite tricarboxylate transporter substrate-binding protein [Ottowia sp.]|uniref:tripartite tricarboxylate transporter substrate-binding protein n=1 Tax=Ottowia sp. TaxID=1898956 RepID=UPI0025D812AC|nr:tripartite tricarboxylate transporter substrate-binding protein [Ottowia sp.]